MAVSDNEKKHLDKNKKYRAELGRKRYAAMKAGKVDPPPSKNRDGTMKEGYSGDARGNKNRVKEIGHQKDGSTKLESFAKNRGKDKNKRSA